jgi:hypothetical protein
MKKKKYKIKGKTVYIVSERIEETEYMEKLKKKVEKKIK